MDIVLLELRDITPIADYFVLCTGTSPLQIRAIMQRITQRVKEEYGVKPWRSEGQPESGWVLLDYADVVIHAFSPEMREYYDLEGLWQEGKTLLRMQ